MNILQRLRKLPLIVKELKYVTSFHAVNKLKNEIEKNINEIVISVEKEQAVKANARGCEFCDRESNLGSNFCSSCGRDLRTA